MRPLWGTPVGTYAKMTKVGQAPLVRGHFIGKGLVRSAMSSGCKCPEIPEWDGSLGAGPVIEFAATPDRAVVPHAFKCLKARLRLDLYEKVVRIRGTGSAHNEAWIQLTTGCLRPSEFWCFRAHTS